MVRVKLIPLIVLALIFVGASGVLASGGTIERVSVSDNGTQGNGPSVNAKLSYNGRYVTFESNASNLVSNDTNGVGDVFVRDRLANTTTLVSMSDNGTQGNGPSALPSISDDGRYVAFYSEASNLVSNDTNGRPDIFVRDRLTNTTTLVSVSDNGTQSNGTSELPSISNDGRYVAFVSLANNLVPNDTNGRSDIFVRDRQMNTTTMVSVSDNGTQGNNLSSSPSISGNGRFISFGSSASNLVPNDTNGRADVFVRDLQTNTTTRVSIASDGTQGNSDSLLNTFGTNCRNLSSDGRYAAFMSDASNLAPNDLNGCTDVFVRDRQTNTTFLISIASDGTQGNSASWYPCLSNDGRYFAFQSQASNLVPDDTNGMPDIFVRDRQTNKTVIASIAADGTQGNTTSQDPSISGDGQYVAFGSAASNLVPNDTNGVMDVFVADKPLYEHLPPSAPVTIPTPVSPRASPSTPPRQLNPSQISAQYVSVNPQQARTNQPVTITTNVVNTGDEAGNYNVTLKINGLLEQTRMVSVGPQGTQPVKFTVTKSQPGTYTVDIGGQTGSFIIAGQRGGTAGKSAGGGLIAFFIMGVLILVAIVLLIRRPT